MTVVIEVVIMTTLRAAFRNSCDVYSGKQRTTIFSHNFPPQGPLWSLVNILFGLNLCPPFLHPYALGKDYWLLHDVMAVSEYFLYFSVLYFWVLLSTFSTFLGYFRVFWILLDTFG